MVDPKTPWKGLDLGELVSSGYTNREIADLAGENVNAARTAVYRRGFKSVIPSSGTVRSRAEEMKPLDAVNYLLGVLDQWLPALSNHTHEIDGWGIHLQPMERLLLALLVDASPRVVSRNQIMDCLYSTRADGEIPADNIVSVLIAHIRKKLPTEMGSIANMHGRGYRFERPS